MLAEIFFLYISGVFFSIFLCAINLSILPLIYSGFLPFLNRIHTNRENLNYNLQQLGMYMSQQSVLPERYDIGLKKSSGKAWFLFFILYSFYSLIFSWILFFCNCYLSYRIIKHILKSHIFTSTNAPYSVSKRKLLEVGIINDKDRILELTSDWLGIEKEKLIFLLNYDKSNVYEYLDTIKLIINLNTTAPAFIDNALVNFTENELSFRSLEFKWDNVLFALDNKQFSSLSHDPIAGWEIIIGSLAGFVSSKLFRNKN